MDVRPIVVNEMKSLELLSMGANQCQDVGTVQAGTGDIQWRTFCAFEPGFHEEVGSFEAQVQLRPQHGMLGEISTPVTAHRTCVNEVRLAREVGGDNKKDFLREAVYGGKRIPPLADVRPHGRSVLVELRDHIEGEPML